ncbi:MAG: hypothetical protein WCZ71_08695, partial [Proteiniphilum sp.]
MNRRTRLFYPTNECFFAAKTFIFFIQPENILIFEVQIYQNNDRPMKRTDSFFYFFLMAAALLLFTYCTGNGKQTPMQVDEVMAISETLAGET